VTIDGYEVHPSVTAERVMDACERHHRFLDDPGFCVACGEEAKSIFPDARGYHCEHCEERAVYGAEELLLYFA
jgi:hypothetical protein